MTCLVFFAVDITVYRNGYHGDLNETFYVGEVDEGARRLVQTTYECLMQAIDAGKCSCWGLKHHGFGSQAQVLIFVIPWEWILLQNTEVLVCVTSRWCMLYNTVMVQTLRSCGWWLQLLFETWADEGNVTDAEVIYERWYLHGNSLFGLLRWVRLPWFELFRECEEQSTFWKMREWFSTFLTHMAL